MPWIIIGWKYLILGHISQLKHSRYKLTELQKFQKRMSAALLFLSINDQNELCFPKRKVVGIFHQLPLKPTNIVWGFASHALLPSKASKGLYFNNQLKLTPVCSAYTLPQSNLNFHSTPPFLMNHWWAFVQPKMWFWGDRIFQIDFLWLSRLKLTLLNPWHWLRL